MRAGKGAIEQVKINPSTYEPMILTVGREQAGGHLRVWAYRRGRRAFRGGRDRAEREVRPGASHGWVRQGESGWEYVLSYAAESRIGRDIVLTEVDLDNLIRAKAADLCRLQDASRQRGARFEDVQRVIIAGGFGHSIDLEKAQTIGLLPDVAPEKFLFVGNGSLLGAQAAFIFARPVEGGGADSEDDDECRAVEQPGLHG